MVVFFDGVVVDPVVGDGQRPPTVGTAVLAAGVQEVAVEEDSVT